MSPADVREVLAVALDAVERADKPLGAPEVSPAVQAAFAAGRRAGLLEAAAHVGALAANVRASARNVDFGPVYGTSIDPVVYREASRLAAELCVLAGEPSPVLCRQCGGLAPDGRKEWQTPVCYVCVPRRAGEP